MSYSFHTTASRSKLHQALEEAVARHSPEPAVATEQREQLDAAVAAAELVAGAVGLPDEDLVVAVTGHANPDHAPRDGWADECITITVGVRRRSGASEVQEAA